MELLIFHNPHEHLTTETIP